MFLCVANIFEKESSRLAEDREPERIEQGGADLLRCCAVSPT